MRLSKRTKVFNFLLLKCVQCVQSPQQELLPVYILTFDIFNNGCYSPGQGNLLLNFPQIIAIRIENVHMENAACQIASPIDVVCVSSGTAFVNHSFVNRIYNL